MFWQAARYNDMDDIKSLEASGVPLDSKDDQGRTGMHQSYENLIHCGKSFNILHFIWLVIWWDLIVLLRVNEGRVC